jgi:hypothetical protein
MDVYKRLARKLDELPEGYPTTRSGVELKILRKIFTVRAACSLDNRLFFVRNNIPHHTLRYLSIMAFTLFGSKMPWTSISISD